MERREALATFAVLASGLVACRSQPPDAIGPDPSTAPPAPRPEPPRPAADDAAVAALRAAVYNCIEAGQTCDAHCQRLLAEGTTAMAGCARTVSDMLAVMRALSELLAAESEHMKALTRVAIEVCRSCEKECKAHAGHHDECKACMQACSATIAAGEKLG